MNPRKRPLPLEPPPAAGGAGAGDGYGDGEVSPPRKRWRNLRIMIRQERSLQDFLIHRRETSGQFLSRLLSVELVSMCERVCQQEVQRAVHYYLNLPPRPPLNQIGHTGCRVKFLNNPQSTFFTTDKIEAEDGGPIKISIFDPNNNKITSPDHPLSKAKLKVLILDSEFWKGGRENWAKSEFNQSVLCKRDKIGPIITGDLFVRLEHGEGIIGNIVFRDNSSWTKSGFRLGLAVVDSEFERVLEGVSKSFEVKDRRGKATQKPDQLLLDHNVQSLKYIGKDRALRLQKNGINKVMDFLQAYHTNESNLRKILGINSESDKSWRAMVQQAKLCEPQFHDSYNNGFNNTNQYLPGLTENMNGQQIHNEIVSNNPVQPLEELTDLSEWIDSFDTQFENNATLFTGNSNYFHGSSSSDPSPFDHNQNLYPDQTGNQIGWEQASVFGASDGVSLERENLQNPGPTTFLTFGSFNPIRGEITPIESSSNNNYYDDDNPSRADSFHSDSCEELVESFKAKITDNGHADVSSQITICPRSINTDIPVVSSVGGPSMVAVPVSPHKWVKIRALFKWISTSPSRARARARSRVGFAPLVHQTPVTTM